MIDFAENVTQALIEGIIAKQSTLENQVKNLAKIGYICGEAIENGNKILLCGNGGSAADAQHLAAELLIRLRPNFTRRTLPALALTMDSSTFTACGNDLGFDLIFERMIEAFGKVGDILIGITTSGNSLNVINAFIKAKSLGITTVGFLGENGGLAQNYCDYSFNAQTKVTARIQELHITAGHIVMELVENYLIDRKLI